MSVTKRNRLKAKNENKIYLYISIYISIYKWKEDVKAKEKSEDGMRKDEVQKLIFRLWISMAFCKMHFIHLFIPYHCFLFIYTQSEIQILQLLLYLYLFRYILLRIILSCDFLIKKEIFFHKSPVSLTSFFVYCFCLSIV